MRLLLAVHGPIASPHTWSGSAAGLVGGLRIAGADVRGLDASCPALERLEQAASFALRRERWRQRYHANSAPGAVLVRRGTGRAVSRRAASYAPVDAVLQVGHWYDLRLGAPTRASIHDANLVVNLRRGDLALDPDAWAVRHALAFERQVARGMDRVLVMSRWLADSFADDLGVDPARIRVVGMGANVSPPAQIPDRRGAAPCVLFVGKAFERKGGPELLRAWARVHARRPDAELVVVGPQRLARVPPGVRFEGRISRSAPGGEERLRGLYAQATVFAMPSRYEPFGGVFLEAMGYGLPCVATRACAMPEIVRDGVSGRVVAPGDEVALADALLELLDDPGRASALGAAGRRRVQRDFSWDGVGERVLAALR